MSTVRLSKTDAARLGIEPGKPRRAKRKAEHLARFQATPPAPAISPEEAARQRSLFERHDRVTVALRLPLPPSINHYWRMVTLPGQGPRMLVSSEGRAYADAVKAAWTSHWKGWTPEPLTGRLRLLVTVCYRDRRAVDLDNRVKPLQDALKHAGAYGDDSQIDSLRVERGPLVAGTGAVDVVLEAIE